jgi:hypothetical protein
MNDMQISNLESKSFLSNFTVETRSQQIMSNEVQRGGQPSSNLI